MTDFSADAVFAAAKAATNAAAFLSWTWSMDGTTLIIHLNTEMPKEKSRPIIMAVYRALKGRWGDVSYSPTRADVHVRDPRFPRPKPDFICTRNGG